MNSIKFPRFIETARKRCYSIVSEIVEPMDTANASRLSTGLELEFLGTSSATSTMTRNVSSIAFNYGGGTVLFDCGEGTVRQFLRSTVRPGQIQAVCITHLHGDHIYGLPGLGMRTIELRQADKRIKVFAPRGLRNIFGRALSHNRQFHIHELFPNDKLSFERRDEDKFIEKVLWNNRDRCFHCFDHPLFTIKAVPIKHSVFCLGYVIQEKETRGRFLVEKLKADFDISPGPIFKQLMNSERVTLPSGKTIISSDYMTKPRAGRKIVILGDTCDPKDIAEHAMDADVLVHEATCSDSERTVALEHYHSTAGMAGAFARAIRAKNLILTHFSPRNFNSNECTNINSCFLLFTCSRGMRTHTDTGTSSQSCFRISKCSSCERTNFNHYTASY